MTGFIIFSILNQIINHPVKDADALVGFACVFLGAIAGVLVVCTISYKFHYFESESISDFVVYLNK